VHVGYSIKDGIIEFYVSDTGIGIPEDRKPAIFDRFVQADIADERALQGSGLGLAIAKSHTELLGGKIAFTSDSGKGSRFYIQLPFQSSEPAIKTPSAKSVKMDNRKPNILITEDDETTGIFLSIILEEHSDSLQIARTGEDAIRQTRENPDLDIILMDIKMPGMNGYAATRKIREFNKDVIIIAQTGFAFSGESEKALEAGCNAYVSKPVSEETLLKTIAKLWNK
jgi:CheY-like chemotaxis protein